MRKRTIVGLAVAVLMAAPVCLCGCRTEPSRAAPATATGFPPSQTLIATGTVVPTSIPETLTPTPCPQAPSLAASKDTGFELSYAHILIIAGFAVVVVLARAVFGLLCGRMVRIAYLAPDSPPGQGGRGSLRRVVLCLHRHGMGNVYLYLMFGLFLIWIICVKRWMGTGTIPVAAAAALVIIIFGSFQAPAWLKPGFLLFYSVNPDGKTFPPLGTDRLRLPLRDRSVVAFCLVNLGALPYRNSQCWIHLDQALEIVADGDAYDGVEHRRSFELHRGSNRAYFKDVVIPAGFQAVLPLLVIPRGKPGVLKGNQVELATESRWGSVTKTFDVTVEDPLES